MQRMSISREGDSVFSTEGQCFEVVFQFGIERDMLVFEGNDIDSLKELAAAFIESKHPSQVPDFDSILLFKHNYTSSNQLELIQNIESLNNNDTIEIVLKVSYGMSEDSEVRPHMLYVHSYKTPTFCDHCGVMLFGLVRQGLKCEGCNGNFHKKCAFKIPNRCSGIALVATNGTLTRKVSEQWSSRAVSSISSTLEIPHVLVVHSYGKPTVCHVCRKLLKGIFRQGLQCKDCKFNCHEKCVDKVPRNCLADYSNDRGESLASDDSDFTDLAEMDISQDEDPMDGGSPTIEAPHTELVNTKSSQIPLQRIAMSVRRNKNRGSKILKSAWLVYFTESDKTKRVHYWRLDTKCICLHEHETTKDVVKEIPLSEILSIDSNLEPMGSRHGRDPYLFTLKTSQEIYYCGERDGFDENTQRIISSDPKSGKGTKVGISWADAIKGAYQSVAANPADVADVCPPPAKVENEVKEEEGKDISEVYQVFSDEILGSGQFGVVYGGVHRKTGKDVAVKVIDKSRFPTKEERALKNEVIILQSIDHAAVVTLERMFETPQRIYVVMHKMRGDMLETILSSPKGRLSERRTKFMIHQILIALKFLHQNNIAHCDLKPENVLLSGVTSTTGYPQIKLCDFGFSRIIGRESFRRSIVGTPAYLAPEVLNNKKYNRSLDMWSVGVIIYVSVSGTFPFNEAEEIEDQIKNAAFMYPPNPWSEISRESKDLINKLLQVKIEKRFNCQQALLHNWMQDYDNYKELRSLEKIVGVRYITHESDDAAWDRYGKITGDEGYSIPEDTVSHL